MKGALLACQEANFVHCYNSGEVTAAFWYARFLFSMSRKQGTLQAFSYLNDACQNLDTFITNLAPGKVQLCNGLVGTQPITQHLQRRVSSSSHGAALLRQLTANASGTLHGNTVVPRIRFITQSQLKYICT